MYCFTSISAFLDASLCSVKKSNVSYKQPSQLPGEDEVRALQIYVDRENESILLPIYGVPVPFHVAMIKVG